MTKLNITLIILFTIAFLVVLIVILFKYFNERIKILDYRINNAQETSIDKVKNKVSILLRLISIVENRYNYNSKTFEDVKKIKPESLVSFKTDKLLGKCYTEIMQVKEDNPKVREVKSLKDIIAEYEENELHIISLRTYYNKYSLEYNNMIKKFPYNLVAKIKNYKMKLLFEGKEFETEYNNNLEV